MENDEGNGNILATVAARLAAEYGSPCWVSAGPPLDQLVATVLSQHTSDVNAKRAFASLRSAYPSWSTMISSPVGEIAAAIRCGGLANVKAERLQQLLRAIIARRGDLSLHFLSSLPPAGAKAWLQSLPGVGPKTAACVLLFSLGMPVMPVDTHVHRVARRLGILDPGVSAEKAHAVLDGILDGDRDLTYSLHLHLIRHGRNVCTARLPNCARCILADCCPSAVSVRGLPASGTMRPDAPDALSRDAASQGDV